MNNVRKYQDVQVMTADRVRLVIMLYEGIVRFNKCAENAIAEGDIKQRSHFINRSMAILGELSNTLNMEAGGEIAENLFRLYDFSMERLSEANTKNDPAPLHQVNRVINELKAGWVAIAEDQGGLKGEKSRQDKRVSNEL